MKDIINIADVEQLDWLCRGNRDAMRFVELFVGHCHLVDDLVDRDKNTTDAQIVASWAAWNYELAFNAFFITHRLALCALMTQAFNAWVDSNQWRTRENVNECLAADVLKGWYHEVIYHVAFLCGGWGHLRGVTSKLRAYDFEKGGS